MKTTDLIEKFYKGREMPRNARQSLVSVVSSLVEGTAVGHEYRVLKSERGGPKPIEVWVEKQKRRA